jgi:hypothetical protein
MPFVASLKIDTLTSQCAEAAGAEIKQTA